MNRPEDAPCDHMYDVTGSLCENSDKFAIDRMLPEIETGPSPMTAMSLAVCSGR